MSAIIFTVYGENVIEESTARNRISGFKEVHFDINDSSRSDHLTVNALNHDDPYQSARELANVIDCDQSAMVRHLYSMGNVQKLVALTTTIIFVSDTGDEK